MKAQLLRIYFFGGSVEFNGVCIDLTGTSEKVEIGVVAANALRWTLDKDQSEYRHKQKRVWTRLAKFIMEMYVPYSIGT